MTKTALGSKKPVCGRSSSSMMLHCCCVTVCAVSLSILYCWVLCVLRCRKHLFVSAGSVSFGCGFLSGLHFALPPRSFLVRAAPLDCLKLAALHAVVRAWTFGGSLVAAPSGWWCGLLVLAALCLPLTCQPCGETT